MTDFPKYLREIAESFPSKAALAEAIGIQPSRLSHALKGTGSYTFNVENCLRLAKAANRPAGEVLRAAGKADVAELLEFLFPDAAAPPITAEQRRVIEDFESLTEQERSALRLLVFYRRRQKRQNARTARGRGGHT